MITVIGPVGPDTWVGVPPNRAARKPSTMAPVSPAIGPAPEATPKASARGRATTAAVRPPVRSPRQWFRALIGLIRCELPPPGLEHR